MRRSLLVFALAVWSWAALGDHAGPTERTVRPVAEGPGDPKALALKLTPAERQVCDMEREIQLLGPSIFSSYGQSGFPTQERWEKTAVMLREALPVLRAAAPEDLAAFPSIRDGYGPVAVSGPSSYGDITISPDADPKQIAPGLKRALDRRRFEAMRTEMYRVINEIGSTYGIKVEPNVGDMGEQTAVLKQLLPHLAALPENSALAKIHISNQSREYLSFSGNQLTLYVQHGTGRVDESTLTKLVESIPGTEHALIADKLTELQNQLTAKENKDKIGKLAAEYRSNDPAQLKQTLKKTIAKQPIQPPAPVGRDPQRDAKLRALSRKFGSDVQIRSFGGPAADAQIAILEKLAAKGYRLKAPARTMLLSASGYGINPTMGGKWFPTLGGDCLPWAVFDPKATEAQIAAFFDPPAPN